MADTTTPPPAAPDLADRIRRLEDSLAGLTAGTVAAPVGEERLAERILAILADRAAQHRDGNGTPGPAGLIPAARTVYTIAADPPPGSVEPPAEPGLRSWLLGNVVGELKLMARMYFDPRYRLSRLAQFGVPAILGLFLVNYLFFNYSCIIPVMQQVGERVGCAVLAVSLYKLLAREVVRYRQVLDYLAQYSYR